MKTPLWMMMVLVAAVIAGCGSAEGGSANGEALLGLWAWSAQENQTVATVTVRETDGRWQVFVDGNPVADVPAGERFLVKLADGERFEGRPKPYPVQGPTDPYPAQEPNDPGRSSIMGQWHQPSSSLAYSDMVTLVELPLVSAGVWEASVERHARPFRVFLDVFIDDDGALAAVIRNPERNEIMRRTRYTVEPDAKGSWELVSGAGNGQRRHALERVTDGLQLNHQWFDEPLLLNRVDPADAVGYFSRPAGTAANHYIEPEQLDDGWEVASAEEAGLNRGALDALVRELATADPRSRRPRLIHSVLVALDGKLVIEEYFHGYKRDTTHDTRSLAKVFSPVLLGALQQSGKSISANDRPIPALLADANEALGDPRKKTITLAHLMSFSSGLDCDVNSDSPGNEDAMWSQQEEPNFWLYTARLDVKHEPGTHYAYCSGSINLVGSRLRDAGGRPVVELFDDLIAKPLGFGRYHWNLMPNGEGYLGGGVYLRPRDVLKIGAMYSAGGLWGRQRIVPEAWVKESTTPVIDITPETTGMSVDEFQNSYFGGSAAYEWRVATLRSGEQTYPYYEATGNGGQILLVVPELKLTALFMGGNYRQGGIWGRWPSEIIGGHVIPALSQSVAGD